MNKGMHMPTFEVQAHGKLRVKSEIGQLWLWHVSFASIGRSITEQ